MTDSTLTIVLNAITAFCVSVILPVILLRIHQRSRKTLVGIAETAGETHLLVNSEHGIILSALAVALRVIANDHPSERTNLAAENAESAVNEHFIRQAIIDQRRK